MTSTLLWRRVAALSGVQDLDVRGLLGCLTLRWDNVKTQYGDNYGEKKEPREKAHRKDNKYCCVQGNSDDGPSVSHSVDCGGVSKTFQVFI